MPSLLAMHESSLQAISQHEASPIPVLLRQSLRPAILSGNKFVLSPAEPCEEASGTTSRQEVVTPISHCMPQ